jgi:hypothetical protein
MMGRCWGDVLDVGVGSGRFSDRSCRSSGWESGSGVIPVRCKSPCGCRRNHPRIHPLADADVSALTIRGLAGCDLQISVGYFGHVGRFKGVGDD